MKEKVALCSFKIIDKGCFPKIINIPKTTLHVYNAIELR